MEKNRFINEVTRKCNYTDIKKAGAVCITCDSPIWANGSAIVEWNGCFICNTGKSYSSEDYEIGKVNFFYLQ